LSASPARHPGGGDARDAFLDGEAVPDEDLLQVARGLGLLEAELAEAEDAVHDLLAELRAPLHLRCRLAFPGVEGLLVKPRLRFAGVGDRRADAGEKDRKTRPQAHPAEHS